MTANPCSISTDSALQWRRSKTEPRRCRFYKSNIHGAAQKQCASPVREGGDPVRELKSDLARAFRRPFLFAMLGSMLCVLFGAFSEVLLLFQAQPPAAMLFQHRAVTLRALSGSAMLFAAPLLAPIPYAGALVEKWHNACNGKILCKLGPHATDTISVELAKQIVDEGRRLGVGFHIHVAQKQQEVAFLRETYGLTPVEYLEETGLLGPDTVAAHCKFLTEHDKTLLRESGLVFAHCCETSGKRGALPPMKEIIDAGVPFCLGTDWLTTDPWTNMRITVIADRLLGCSTQDINAAKALRKSTIEAACALGLGERIGSLEAGKEADLVMLSLQSANLVPLFDDPVATIVYNANRHDVKLVMVQGDILVQDGRLTRQDEAAILREGQRTAASLYRQHLH